MHSEPTTTARFETPGPPVGLATSIVVFTAVDGVLRDGTTGSCRHVREALDLLVARGIPVVLTAKADAADVRDLQRDLGIQHPFICQSGAALHIPRGYFEELDGLTSGDDEWEVFAFGAGDPSRAVRLLTSLYSVRGEDILTIGFACDWADRALLASVQVPVVVRQAGSDHERLLRRIPGAYLTNAAGPAGWSEAVLGSTA
jgi:predicted mannosyl-3-phosphoglycerate phosphatase (HAD superfamily)